MSALTPAGEIELDRDELAAFARDRALAGPTDVYDRLYNDLRHCGCCRCSRAQPAAWRGTPVDDLGERRFVPGPQPRDEITVARAHRFRLPHFARRETTGWVISPG